MLRTATALTLAAIALTATPHAITAQSTGNSATNGAATADTLVYVLEPIVVEGRMDDLVGVASTASEGRVGYVDLRMRPLVREGEILETVPGLIATQHSGDGKSNQMFVRGFNLDHGTDFSTSVEGMQVNVPTHAHGQGYTDINFIIPELVDHVEYRLGTSHAVVGDFGSAGSAQLRLRRSLDRPFATSTLGANGFRRLVAASSTRIGAGDLLVGAEVKGYDGPWAVEQDLRKESGMLRYSLARGNQLLSVLALGYRNAWNASDQIPERLIENGTIGRFGQIDPTLGGDTYRASLSLAWSRIGDGSSQRLDLYGLTYDLDLYSNFTYFLDDTDDGDQIRQHDDGRYVFGGRLAHIESRGDHTVTLGLESRTDLLDVALQRTTGREVRSTVRRDEGTQWASGAFASLESTWSPTFRTVLGLRGDAVRASLTSDLPANSGTASDAIVSPKASLIYTLSRDVELYLSGGFGFHSNDARGMVQAIDPATNESVDPVDPLVRSRGAELGVRATFFDRWRTTVTGWTIDLDSELLFVGDAGTTEASPGSRRLGATWTNAFRITPTLTGDADVSLADARFPDAPTGEDRIPGALEHVVTAGLTWEPGADGPWAVARLRHFGAYPLVEDDSERADPTTLANLSAGWRFGALRVGASLLNVLDSKDADIQYFYSSRLEGEPVGGIDGRHVHPVEPRQLRLTLSWGL